MADAWTNLLVHSSLGTGDAWEHLLAQEGGSTIQHEIRYIGESALEFSIVATSTEFDVMPAVLQFDVFDGISTDIDFSTTETAIDFEHISYEQ